MVVNKISHIRLPTEIIYSISVYEHKMGCIVKFSGDKPLGWAINSANVGLGFSQNLKTKR